MAGFPKPSQVPGNKAKKPMSGVKITAEMIKQALIKTRGNVSRASDLIGCCRHTLHLRINDDPSIKQVLDNCRERFLDDAEDVLQNKALSGDTTTLLFSLKTLGKSRGYELETNQIAESVTKGALDFIYNKSKNPAES